MIYSEYDVHILVIENNFPNSNPVSRRIVRLDSGAGEINFERFVVLPRSGLQPRSVTDLGLA